jgi:hypothetical protein
MSVDKMTMQDVCKNNYKLSIDKIAIGEMSVDEMVANKMSCGHTNDSRCVFVCVCVCVRNYCRQNDMYA